MHNYLPRYYEDIREANAIIDTESAQIEKLNADAEDVLNQFFIDTATWGLANWEAFCGLPTDESKPISQRRELLKSKVRGVGTVTVGLIKSVAESYNNGQVDVIEDNANYTVTIKFVSTYGVPDNLDDIQKALRDIIPAHLAVNFSFMFVTYDTAKSTYVNYDAIVATGYTYSQLLTNGG